MSVGSSRAMELWQTFEMIQKGFPSSEWRKWSRHISVTSKITWKMMRLSRFSIPSRSTNRALHYLSTFFVVFILAIAFRKMEFFFEHFLASIFWRETFATKMAPLAAKFFGNIFLARIYFLFADFFIEFANYCIPSESMYITTRDTK